MKSKILPVVVAVAIAMLLGMYTPTAQGSPTRGMATVCLESDVWPVNGRTVHVPKALVDPLIKATRSYRGPCAEYGESAPRGDGRLTAYTQVEHGKPQAIGMVATADTLKGLPHDPPTDGSWCFDKDGNGTIDPMKECANGYGNILKLDSHFTQTVDTPFRYLMADWNPHGHGPPNVYDKPHFDVHFYIQKNAERKAIRPGPCPELVNCDDFQLGKKLPAPKYRPADFKDMDAQSPGMGNHLIDTTGPEFHGAPFTHTFIYGTWDEKVTFLEPMITKDYLQGLVEGSQDDRCVPIKTPKAYQKSGWYPTSYCMRYRDNRDEVTVSMEDFVYRKAA